MRLATFIFSSPSEHTIKSTKHIEYCTDTWHKYNNNSSQLFKMLLNIYTSTLLLLAAVTPSSSFSPSNFPSTQRSYSTQSLALFNLGGSSAGGTAKIPSSPNDRDKQAINAVKAAIQKPRDPQCPLIECEFPALAALNKLGDGSLRSALEAEDANIAFAKKLVNGIAPLPFGGPGVSVIMSTSASGSFTKKAKAGVKGAKLYALREGVPEVRKGGVCIFVTPCSQKDYQTAKSLAQSGCPTVVLNGFAKVCAIFYVPMKIQMKSSFT